MLEKLAGNLPRLSIFIKYFLGWFILFCDLLIKLFFVMGWSQNMDCYEIWIMFYISPITQIRRKNKNENFEIYLVLIQSLNKIRQFIARNTQTSYNVTGKKSATIFTLLLFVCIIAILSPPN